MGIFRYADPPCCAAPRPLAEVQRLIGENVAAQDAALRAGRPLAELQAAQRRLFSERDQAKFVERRRG